MQLGPDAYHWKSCNESVELMAKFIYDACLFASLMHFSPWCYAENEILGRGWIRENHEVGPTAAAWKEHQMGCEERMKSTQALLQASRKLPVEDEELLRSMEDENSKEAALDKYREDWRKALEDDDEESNDDEDDEEEDKDDHESASVVG